MTTMHDDLVMWHAHISQRRLTPSLKAAIARASMNCESQRYGHALFLHCLQKSRRGHPTMHVWRQKLKFLKTFSGSCLLLIKYYNFNYGNFSGSCVLQGNSSGEASGSALFLPACCKLHIGVRRAQSENLMNSLRLCAEWQNGFFALYIFKYQNLSNSL